MSKYIKKGYNPKSRAPKGNKYSVGNKSNTGRKHTEETKKLMSESYVGMTGRKHSEYSKAKMRAAHIKFMKSGKIKTTETDIEKIIRVELENEGIQFIPQYPIPAIALVDFYIPDSNIVIQCDGNFWHHSNWAKDNGKDITDEKQNLYLKGNGYKVLRFTGTEIKESTEECIKKIKEKIYETRD